LHLFIKKTIPIHLKILKTIAVDEWYELLGSKRGVQVELAVARIVNLRAYELGISNG
jgi:ATP-dependent Lhr-like helicase